MKDLHSSSHKLRRPSFSNTLSELPEVEEPVSSRETSKLDATSYPVLPPISHDDIKPIPRPRLHTIPATIMERPKLISDKEVVGDSSRGGTLGRPRRHSIDGKMMSSPVKNTEMPSPVLSSESPSKSQYQHTTSTTRAHSPTRCSEGSMSPRHSTDVTPTANSGHRVTQASSTSTESHNVKRAEGTPTDVTRSKEQVILRWRKALDEEDRRSRCGSLESLGSFGIPESIRSRRRSSVPSNPVSSRRWSNPEFAKTNRRVDILMKYGKALRDKYRNGHRDNRTTPGSTAIRTLADLVIDIPKKPRFSSFMSPEAQYSLMKCYEDTLYRRLSDSVPDYTPLLKRSKTPNSNVEIKPKNSSLSFLENFDDEEVNTNDDNDYDNDDNNDEDDTESHAPTETTITGGEDNATSSFVTQINHYHHHQHVPGYLRHKRLHQPKPGSYQPSCPSTVQSISSTSLPSDAHTTTAASTHGGGGDPTKTVLRSLRRLSVSLGKGLPTNRHLHEDPQDADDGDEEDICSNFTRRHRCYSLPSVGTVPSDRRLMLAYRLQSAMDILDDLRDEDETKLSPRRKVKRGTALADYNAWVSDWNEEFYLWNRHG